MDASMKVLVGHTVREPTVHELQVAIEHGLLMREVREPTARELQVAIEHELNSREVEAEASVPTDVDIVSDGETALQFLGVFERDLAVWRAALVERVKQLESATNDQNLLYAVAVATGEKVGVIEEIVTTHRAKMGLDAPPPAEDPRAELRAVYRAERGDESWLQVARTWVARRSSPY